MRDFGGNAWKAGLLPASEALECIAKSFDRIAEALERLAAAVEARKPEVKSRVRKRPAEPGKERQ